MLLRRWGLLKNHGLKKTDAQRLNLNLSIRVIGMCPHSCLITVKGAEHGERVGHTHQGQGTLRDEGCHMLAVLAASHSLRTCAISMLVFLYDRDLISSSNVPLSRLRLLVIVTTKRKCGACAASIHYI